MLLTELTDTTSAISWLACSMWMCLAWNSSRSSCSRGVLVLNKMHKIKPETDLKRLIPKKFARVSAYAQTHTHSRMRMHRCPCTNKHTHMRMGTYTCTRKHASACVRNCAYTHVHMRTRLQELTYTHITHTHTHNTQTRISTHVKMCMHTRTRKHAQTHAYVRSYTLYAQTQTLKSSRPCSPREHTLPGNARRMT